MTETERQASTNTLDIPPPVQGQERDVPHVSKPVAVFAVIGFFWGLIWFLGAGIFGKLVILVAAIAFAKMRGDWIKGVFVTLRGMGAPPIDTDSKPAALDPKEAEIHQMTHERLDDLPPEMIVRGVWEHISTYSNNWQLNMFGGSQLRGVDLGRVGDLFAVRSEKKPTWGQALFEPLGDGREVVAWLDLEKIASVELENAARYYGEAGQAYGYEVPKRYREKLFDKRHPYASRNKGGGGYMDGNCIWIVFVFEKDGTRRPIFKTFSYDLALRLRTQTNNLFDQWRMGRVAQKAAPRDVVEDYL